jgi:hypothetical protein
MKQSKNKNPSKPYWELNLEELREATKEFDREFVPTKPLTPAMKAQWERAKRKRGRPVKGGGAKVISLSVERGLLDRADALAKEQGMSRADLFARGIHAVLAVYAGSGA